VGQSDVHLAAVILALNNAPDIVPCVESVSWCDEVVVFDAFSTDGTVGLAQAAGARVIQHRFEDFARQRNAALDAMQADWVFFVDSDERATPDLAREVREVVHRAEINGWWVPRHNYVFGRLTRGAGYYPDYQMRLLRSGYGRYERPASEIVVLQGQDGHLTRPLIHHNYRTVAQFHQKQRLREPFEAMTLHRQGVRLKPWTLLREPLREFRRRYITLKGYEDGLHGLRLCLLLAYYFGFRNYLRLWQMRRSGVLPGPGAVAGRAEG
jgi:(heptosyl)LPS beta-1,4-glucosyltransferase